MPIAGSMKRIINELIFLLGGLTMFGIQIIRTQQLDYITKAFSERDERFTGIYGFIEFATQTGAELVSWLLDGFMMHGYKMSIERSYKQQNPGGIKLVDKILRNQCGNISLTQMVLINNNLRETEPIFGRQVISKPPQSPWDIVYYYQDITKSDTMLRKMQDLESTLDTIWRDTVLVQSLGRVVRFWHKIFNGREPSNGLAKIDCDKFYEVFMQPLFQMMSELETLSIQWQELKYDKEWKEVMEIWSILPSQLIQRIEQRIIPAIIDALGALQSPNRDNHEKMDYDIDYNIQILKRWTQMSVLRQVLFVGEENNEYYSNKIMWIDLISPLIKDEEIGECITNIVITQDDNKDISGMRLKIVRGLHNKEK